MKRFLVGILILILSLGLMGFSLLHKIPVYEEDLPLNEFVFYEDISELELTEFTTFGGVARSPITGRLIIQFDRNQPRGRTACPT